MTHQPECPNVNGDCCPWVGQRTATGVCDCQCDCDRLTAAYRRGVQAARDAVAVRLHADPCDCEWCRSVTQSLLAAIDALRGDA